MLRVSDKDICQLRLHQRKTYLKPLPLTTRFHVGSSGKTNNFQTPIAALLPREFSSFPCSVPMSPTTFALRDIRAQPTPRRPPSSPCATILQSSDGSHCFLTGCGLRISSLLQEFRLDCGSRPWQADRHPERPRCLNHCPRPREDGGIHSFFHQIGTNFLRRSNIGGIARSREDIFQHSVISGVPKVQAPLRLDGDHVGKARIILQ